jgi:hypothetical protein
MIMFRAEKRWGNRGAKMNVIFNCRFGKVQIELNVKECVVRRQVKVQCRNSMWKALRTGSRENGEGSVDAD